MPLLTNAILLTPPNWFDLGVAPLTVATHGSEQVDVVLAVSDVQPPATFVEGEPLRSSRFFGGGHVWALAPRQQGRIVVTAPDIGGSSGGPVTLADGADIAQGGTADATWTGSGAGSLVAILKAVWLRFGSVLMVQEQPFQPVRGTSVALTVGPSATTSPIALPACVATSYRVRNTPSSASAVTWIMATTPTSVPTIPTPYTTAGAGGSPGDKTIDPGGVETIGLSAAQQAALAAGTLVLSGICPAGGSAVMTVSFGFGG